MIIIVVLIWWNLFDDVINNVVCTNCNFVMLNGMAKNIEEVTKIINWCGMFNHEIHCWCTKSTSLLIKLKVQIIKIFFCWLVNILRKIKWMCKFQISFNIIDNAWKACIFKCIEKYI